MTDTNRTVGVVGLGEMGELVARNLGRSEHRVFGFDVVVDVERDARLEQSGVRVHSSLEKMCADVEVLVTVLPDSSVVERVAHDVMALPKRPQLWIDVTTGLPERTRSIAARLSEVGIEFVDAPSCNGGSMGMRADGGPTNLLCMGGSDLAVAAAKPVLEWFSGEVVHVGPLGAGHLVKLMSNTIKMTTEMVVGEAYSLGLANGIEAADLEAILRRTVSGTTVNYDNVDRHIMKRPNSPEAKFPVALAAKDLRYFTMEAGSKDLPATTASGALAQLLVAARSGLRGLPAMPSTFSLMKGDFIISKKD